MVERQRIWMISWLTVTTLLIDAMTINPPNTVWVSHYTSSITSTYSIKVVRHLTQ